MMIQIRPPKKLFVCCFGQPVGHYCWGHIYNELARRDRILGAVDTYEYQTTRSLRVIHAVVQRVSKWFYKRAHFDFKGTFQRRVRGWNSSRLAAAAQASAILHITTLDMPAMRTAGRDHYLLIDSTWHSWSRFESRSGYSDRLWRDIELLDRRSFEQARHIFTLGAHVCDDLVEHYNVPRNKCTPIGTGPGALLPYFGPKDYTSRSVLFVAKTRLDSKGGLLLVESFRLLSLRDPSIHLTIVGSEDAVRIAGGLPNITVRSFIPLSELQQLFNRSSLFVLPALNEPWGMVYLEAMACRTPVLGLKRGALPELTRNGELGFLIDKPDATELANAILDALSDVSRLERMGVEGQKHALTTYTWERAVDRMLAVIDDRSDHEE
jgi:glycosyltransferase involved in cell wall biosynthesis